MTILDVDGFINQHYFMNNTLLRESYQRAIKDLKKMIFKKYIVFPFMGSFILVMMT